MISSFGAILAWKLDNDDAAVATDADDYDDDHKSDPYMFPSYAGDTKTVASYQRPQWFKMAKKCKIMHGKGVLVEILPERKPTSKATGD